MPLHLIKLASGVKDIEGLQRRLSHGGPIAIRTRNMPKRADELLDGGSLFWVGGGSALGRQVILEVGTGTYPDGSACAVIVLDGTVVPVERQPHKAFQGWRYLEAAKAPRDILPGAVATVSEEMPKAMRKELQALGLL